MYIVSKLFYEYLYNGPPLIYYIYYVQWLASYFCKLIQKVTSFYL